MTAEQQYWSVCQWCCSNGNHLHQILHGSCSWQHRDPPEYTPPYTV